MRAGDREDASALADSVPLAPFLSRAQSPRDWGGADGEDGPQAQDSLPPARPPPCPCLAPGTWRSSGAGPRSGRSHRVLTAACLTLGCCSRIRTCSVWPVARAAAHLSAVQPSSAGARDGGEGRGSRFRASVCVGASGRGGTHSCPGSLCPAAWATVLRAWLKRQMRMDSIVRKPLRVNDRRL